MLNTRLIADLLSGPEFIYRTLKPSTLNNVANTPGVYMIYVMDESIPELLQGTQADSILRNLEGNKFAPLYVGRSKNLKQRLYQNHLMGKSNSAPVKYGISRKKNITPEKAKEFMRNHCRFKYLVVRDVLTRCILEAHLIGLLAPPFNITEEH